MLGSLWVQAPRTGTSAWCMLSSNSCCFVKCPRTLPVNWFICNRARNNRVQRVEISYLKVSRISSLTMHAFKRTMCTNAWAIQTCVMRDRQRQLKISSDTETRAFAGSWLFVATKSDFHLWCSYHVDLPYTNLPQMNMFVWRTHASTIRCLLWFPTMEYIEREFWQMCLHVTERQHAEDSEAFRWISSS